MRITIMAFKPIILWTDAFIYLLVGTGLVFAWIVRRRQHLRAPWQRVVQSRSGVVSMVVLALFLLIGLLDSVHFRPVVETGNSGVRSYGVEGLSLLDWAVGPLRQRPEKTYSAPLATHLYAKETIELADGRQGRSFPRLLYGGAHLEDPDQDKIKDIALRGAVGLGLALLLWGLAGSIWVWLLARRRRIGFRTWALVVCRGQSEIPWMA
ncbi:MAG: ABC transporter permease, partial [Pseudomonadota bacterium]